jgi:DNA-binding HxlR family transcriptional regulator
LTTERYLTSCIPFFKYAPSGKYLLERKNMADDKFSCGLDVALSVLGAKWKPLILFHLAHGTRRYGELKRAVTRVSDKVLTQQLKELQDDGVVLRVDYREIPPKVEYSLTPFGRTLGKALAPLCEWGVRHRGDVAKIKARRRLPQRRIAA